MIPKLSFLQTGLLTRRRGTLAPMPGLTNPIGSIQMEADLCAVKHGVFPPVSGCGEITGQVLLGDRQLGQLAPVVSMQWLAYGVKRKLKYEGWEFSSSTSILPEEGGFLVEWRVVNRRSSSRRLPFGLILSGRCRNSGSDGYSWEVPEVPTDVAQMRDRVGLNIKVTAGEGRNSLCFQSCDEPAFCIQTVSPGATISEEGLVRWNPKVKSGGGWSGHLLVVYGKSRREAENLAQKWSPRIAEIAPATRASWEALWKAAFTPGNEEFSGHLPILHSESEALKKLYYNAVLTLLVQRRRYSKSILKTAYLTLGQRRGEGSIYLAWDLPYIASALALLDPDALFEHWRALNGSPMFSHMVLNLFKDKHRSFPCVADPYARISPLVELQKAGQLPRLAEVMIARSGKPVNRFRKNGETVYGDEETHTISSREAILEAALAHRKFHLPKSALVDFGDRGNYLECATNYAHGTAGHTAIQAWAILQAERVLGEKLAKPGEVKRLTQTVMSLYRKGEGFFDCLHRSGQRRPARNLYDIGLTLSTLGADLPKTAVKEMDHFVRKHLSTPTWARCIASFDPDSASGMRCDHQWAGCFVAWPGQYIVGLKQANYRPEWITEWVEGISKITAQGPFAQAYFAEDVVDPECGGAVKSFDDLPQGNHWSLSSGAVYAQVVLEAILGWRVDKPKLDAWPGMEGSHEVIWSGFRQ